jgi:hypothetical protein
MAKAVIHDLTKTMKQNIDEFYGNASVYRPNKYFVGFFGEYIKLAVDKMAKGAKSGNLIHGSYIHLDAFNAWKQLFYHDDAEQLDMRWACAEITIPHTSSKIDTPTYIDSIKSIKYPIISSTTGLGELKIKVRDDKHLMWYQFFNALNNCFYRAQILKPRSSFQKMSIYVAPVQEQFVHASYTDEFNNARQEAIDSVVSQVFEFNSAVLKDIASMNLKNDNKDILEYMVTFSVPNTFQGSFNNTYKGLRDNTAIGIDKNLFGDGKYKDNEFTISKNILKSETNGYYADD